MQDGVAGDFNLIILAVRSPGPLLAVAPLLLYDGLASLVEELTLTMLDVGAPLPSVLVSALSVRHGSIALHLAIDKVTFVNIAIVLGQLSLAHNNALLEVTLVQVATLIKEVCTLAVK